MVLFILLIFVYNQEVVPYKASEEFEIKLDYQFKTRPASSAYEFKFDESSQEHSRRVNNSPLPYLTLNIEILKANENEERIHGFKGQTQFMTKRGIKTGSMVSIEMGFTDDMKDRVTPHEYALVLMDKSKQEVSKIVIFIEEDGSFYVNGEKRGKF